jgi:hypothetical protein
LGEHGLDVRRRMSADERGLSRNTRRRADARLVELFDERRATRYERTALRGAFSFAFETFANPRASLRLVTHDNPPPPALLLGSFYVSGGAAFPITATFSRM